MPVHYGLWEAVMCVLVLMSRKKTFKQGLASVFIALQMLYFWK